MQFWLANENDTRAAGAALASTLVSMAATAPVVVYVRGNLGAGKSTLVRGLLTEIGVSGVMPSPTYTLVEPYHVGTIKVFHMDAYRLADGAELDYLGLDDVDEPGSILLVEWPDNVRDALPEPSITLDLEVAPHPHRYESAKRRPNTNVAHSGQDASVSEIDSPETADAGGEMTDPGRLLRVTVNAVPGHERERLLSAERWSELIRVVT